MTAPDLAPAADLDEAGSGGAPEARAVAPFVPAAVVASIGVALAVLCGTGNEAFRGAGSTAVATEVLLVAAGLAVGEAWRERGGVRRLAAVALPGLVGLGAFAAVYTGLLATGPEVLPARASAVASAVGLTNWWVVLDPPLQLAPAPPLASLWLPTIVVQAVAIGLLARWWRARRGPAEPAVVVDDRMPAGVRLALAGAVASAAWMAALYLLGRASSPGSSPLGDPGALGATVVRLLNIDGGSEPARLLYGTDTRLSGFLLGVAVASAGPWLRRRRLPAIPILIGGAALLVLAAVQGPGDLGWLALGGLLVVGACAALMGAAVATAGTAAAPAIGVVAWVGRRAWSIYLWIAPVVILTETGRSELEGGTQMLVRLLAPVALGLASVAVLERWLGRATTDHRGAPRVGLRLALVELSLAAVVLASLFPVRQPLYITQNVEEDDTVNVLFAGDSMPYGMGLVVNGRELDKEIGVTALLAALPGCGITPGELLNEGVYAQRAPLCDELQSLFKYETLENDPAVTVMLAWAWELFDHRVTLSDGSTVQLEVGTPEWREWFARATQESIDLLTATGSVVMLVTMPCVDPDADTPHHPTSDAALQPFRLEEVNSIVRQMAMWNPGRTVLVDLNGEYLCPDGDYRAYIDGQLMSDDSVHFTEDGAAKAWVDYIGPRVQELLGVTEPTVGADGGDP